MMSNAQSSSRSFPGFRDGLLVLISVAALGVGVVPAHAQLGFTEFAITDPALNSSPATDFWIASAAPADVDADGDLDLLIAGYFVVYPTEENPEGSLEHRLTLYRNDGPAGAEWTLTPIAVDAAGLSFGATDLAWADYDNDGDHDVVVASEGATTLYRNDGGTLVRTATALPSYFEDSDFSTMDLRSLTWADVDNDGRLDLLIPSVVLDFTYQPTAVFHNDGPGPAGDWTFTDTGAALSVASNGVSAWADMEADGDLDLLLGNVSPYGDSFLETYRNDAGTLVAAESGLASIRYGTADWGDADNDGDLDVVYAGNIDLPDGTGETVVRILVNDGPGVYTPIDVAHDFGVPNADPWLSFSAVTWADYDSDGDVDLLVSGEWLGPTDIEGRAVVYSNNGGTFTLASEPLPAPVAGNAGGAFTWFDVDGDGDLDYFVAGGYYVPDGNGLIEARTQLFRNDALGMNAAPTVPPGLQANVSGTDVTLSWSPATDDGTPPSAMTYELEVSGVTGGALGSGSGALAASGRPLPQPGNVSGNTTWTLRALEPGAYTWTVRAVDNAFNGGLAAHGSFVVGSPTSVAGGPDRGFSLSPAYPSPFTREARFSLSLLRDEDVMVALHDVQGHRVAVIHDGRLAPGVHPMVVRPADLPSGVYFIRATGLSQAAVRRITLLR
jgi:hypothetical protein